jgi:hypothetical protein
MAKAKLVILASKGTQTFIPFSFSRIPDHPTTPKATPRIMSNRTTTTTTMMARAMGTSFSYMGGYSCLGGGAFSFSGTAGHLLVILRISSPMT